MYALEADVSRMRDGRVTNSETQSMAMVLLSTMLSLQEKHRDIQISRLASSQGQASGPSLLKKTRSANNLFSVAAAKNLNEGSKNVKPAKKKEVAEAASGGAAGSEAGLFGLPSGIAAQDKLGNTALHVVLIQATNSEILIEQATVRIRSASTSTNAARPIRTPTSHCDLFLAR